MKFYLHLILALQVWVVQALDILSAEEIILKSISLVYIYSNDCKFCKDFNPIIDYLSDLYNHNSDFQIVKINGKAHKSLSKLFLVQSFPTLKLYDNIKKSVITYSGDRLIDLIEDFITESSNARPDISKIRTSLIKINSLNDVDIYAKNKPLLIAFVDLLRQEWKHCFRPFHFYNALSDANEEVNFAVCSITDVKSEVLQELRVSHSPSLVYLHGETIGIFQTLGGESDLSMMDVSKFLNLSVTREVGNWFDSIPDLHSHADQARIHLKPSKPGMNHVANANNNFANDAESQYEQLLAKISL